MAGKKKLRAQLDGAHYLTGVVSRRCNDWRQKCARAERRADEMERLCHEKDAQVRELASWLMSPHITVNERVVDQVDAVLAPHIGRS